MNGKVGETTQGRTGMWANRPGGEMTRGERESGRNGSGANGKVGETTRILSRLYYTCQTVIDVSICVCVASIHVLKAIHTVKIILYKMLIRWSCEPRNQAQTRLQIAKIVAAVRILGKLQKKKHILFQIVLCLSFERLRIDVHYKHYLKCSAHSVRKISK